VENPCARGGMRGVDADRSVRPIGFSPAHPHVRGPIYAGKMGVVCTFPQHLLLPYEEKEQKQ
jgi:hypothetical protein